jgi:hypothetical protein
MEQGAGSTKQRAIMGSADGVRKSWPRTMDFRGEPRIFAKYSANPRAAAMLKGWVAGEYL